MPTQLLEAINGTLAIIYLMIIGIVFWYVIDKFRVYGWSIRRYDETAAALAMITFTFGGLLIRAPIWWSRHLLNQGIPFDTNSLIFQWLIIAGLSVEILGGVCLVRVLSPMDWGYLPWVGGALIALAFGIGLAL